MKREDYLRFCRYYKGEEEPPTGVDAGFWYYEQKWVDLSLKKDDYLGQMLTDYLHAGLRQFEDMDHTPITLKALLFNRYTHWSYSPDGFEEWYHDQYMSKAGQDISEVAQ